MVEEFNKNTENKSSMHDVNNIKFKDNFFSLEYKKEKRDNYIYFL